MCFNYLSLLFLFKARPLKSLASTGFPCESKVILIILRIDLFLNYISDINFSVASQIFKMINFFLLLLLFVFYLLNLLANLA